ncbi:rRNA biogenesis protein rrp5 [Clostridium bovifaecis]|uniref:rRNA biogenesis protein rrp5 n=1 Tax=Clostridium bovifaecis TaxID=2184719 RepID=A0A6I6F4E4_9CLOT|nr:rRNA biogenesis protein rrp5 [Clostridium bovifaecis]
MNINIELKIKAPEVMAAILALAESLTQMKLEVEGLGVRNEKEDKEIKENREITALKDKTITLKELREKLVPLTQSGKRLEVKALIESFGASKLTEVKEEDYEALLKQVESI